MVGERWKIGYIIEGKAGKYPKDRALGEGLRKYHLICPKVGSQSWKIKA